MRLAYLILALILLPGGLTQAATGKVIKVLPHFLDVNGRIALSPSLFERDAYQAYLRLNPEKRAGLRFSIHWKTHKPLWEPLRIQVQLRGTAEGNLPKEHILETAVEHSGWLGKWTHLDLSGQAYKAFGEVTAWRVTIWEGDQLLSEQKSFLW